MKTNLILACAGKGERANQNKNKLLVAVGAQTCLERTLNAFFNTGLFDKIVITSSKTDFEEILAIAKGKATVVLGGNTRSQSIKNALKTLDDGIVLIHDGARPFISPAIIIDCIESVKKYGSGIVAYPTRDTIISANDDEIENYLGKSGLFSVQTPQGFFVNQIKKAYDLAGDKAYNDDGQVYKEFIGVPHLVLGSSKNVKITFPEDLKLLSPSIPRFGTGFDCHKLVEGRKLILGGIEIPHDKGLLGHSDADVLTHAVMDAILSATSMRDIGYHFSDKDAKYKDACSIDLLNIVLQMIKEKGYKVDSVSATIMAEKPKLLQYIPKISENLASILNVPIEKVGIGATTLEGLGFVGREEGICTHATATIINI